MNKDILEGTWKQFKGQIRNKWGKLTDDEIDKAEGNLEYLAGTIQKKYGESKDRVEKDLQLMGDEYGYKFRKSN